VCNTSVHRGLKGSAYAPSQLPRLTEPNPATEDKKVIQVIQASKLFFWSWDSWAFTARRSGIPPKLNTHYLLLRTPESELEKYMGMILTHMVLNSLFDFHAFACTHAVIQFCNPLCSAPCRTEPFTNPSKAKSTDFESNPQGFLIYIS